MLGASAQTCKQRKYMFGDVMNARKKEPKKMKPIVPEGVFRAASSHHHTSTL